VFLSVAYFLIMSAMTIEYRTIEYRTIEYRWLSVSLKAVYIRIFEE